MTTDEKDAILPRWYVTWTVPSLTQDKIHYVGPYTSLQAQAEARDIWGYDGVVPGQITVELPNK